MADLRHGVGADHCAAALILALGAALFYGWSLAPAEHAAQVWNILGAFARLCLLCAVLWHRRGLVLWVGAWWAFEELQVIGCSALFIFAPWPIEPGQAQCSSLLGYDIGKIGAVIMAALALSTVRTDSLRGGNGGS